MPTESFRAPARPIFLASALLLWPALLNGYPLVFSDTGTYLSQAIEHYLGWDRPAFYSLFMLPLHLTLTTWPVVVVQALLSAHTLHLLRRALYPLSSPWWLVALVAGLSVATVLPWLVCQLIPDLLTPLLVIALTLLAILPERLSRAERLWLVGFAAWMTASHQSHLPLALALIALLVPARGFLGASALLGRAGMARLLAIPALAIAATISLNALGHGRVALSPFGSVFLLARLIEDGPARDVLARDCPHPGWTLCAYTADLPATSDEFLWHPDSPLIRAGGAKRVAPEAGEIVAAAIAAEPWRVLRDVLANAGAQFTRFASGDGLEHWPGTVTATLARDFPAAEYARYAAARQTSGSVLLPGWLAALHRAVVLFGLAATPVAFVLCLRQSLPQAGFCAAVLIALVVNAAVTGGLSGPHDRYQSRLAWLAPLAALIAAPALNPSSGRARERGETPAASSALVRARRPASALSRSR
jgi:hypothetical protein